MSLAVEMWLASKDALTKAQEQERSLREIVRAELFAQVDPGRSKTLEDQANGRLIKLRADFRRNISVDTAKAWSLAEQPPFNDPELFNAVFSTSFSFKSSGYTKLVAAERELVDTALTERDPSFSVSVVK